MPIKPPALILEKSDAYVVGASRIPGQMPRSMTPRLDPALTMKPEPDSVARRLSDVEVYAVGDVVRDLGLSIDEQNTLTLFLKDVLRSANEIELRTRLVRFAFDRNYEPALGAVIFMRALKLYRASLSKSEATVLSIDLEKADKVAKDVLDAIDKKAGTRIDALKHLADKHGGHTVAAVVRKHVREGKLLHTGGVLAHPPEPEEPEEKQEPDLVISVQNDGGAKGVKVQKAPAKKPFQKSEGDHGGHVIGHTSSGKPIYAAEHVHAMIGTGGKKQSDAKKFAAFREGHAGWSAGDHAEAAAIHGKNASGSVGNSIKHGPVAQLHGMAAASIARDSAPSSAPSKKGPSRPANDHMDGPRSFEKSEGERGGHVIGHTGSGKPIYQHETVKDTKARSFTAQDHLDAAKAHKAHATKAPDASHYGGMPDIVRSEQFKRSEDHESASRWATPMGRTSTGKDVHDVADHAAHKSFSPAEHREAAKMHDAKRAEIGSKPQTAMSAPWRATDADRNAFAADTAQAAHHEKQADAHFAASHMEKSMTVLVIDLDAKLQKGAGEGSHGGHVIGHTSSGKPIYSGHEYEGKRANGKGDGNFVVAGGEKKAKFDQAHEGWSTQDHKDAAKTHQDAQDSTKNQTAKDRHYSMWNAHRRAAESGVQKSESTNNFQSGADMTIESWLSKAGFQKNEEDMPKDGGGDNDGDGVQNADDEDEKPGVPGGDGDSSPLASGSDDAPAKDDDSDDKPAGKGKVPPQFQKGFGDGAPPDKDEAADKAEDAAANAPEPGEEDDDGDEDAEKSMAGGLGEWLQKGAAEGSRGGHVVGHDAHGKPIYEKKAGKAPANKGTKKQDPPASAETTRELALFAENDSHLHHTSEVPIQKNLDKKIKSGKYDHEKAKKLWNYHADRTAQKYHAEFGSSGQKWHEAFPSHERRALAGHFADKFKEAHDGGEMDHLGKSMMTLEDIAFDSLLQKGELPEGAPGLSNAGNGDQSLAGKGKQSGDGSSTASDVSAPTVAESDMPQFDGALVAPGFPRNGGDVEKSMDATRHVLPDLADMRARHEQQRAIMLMQKGGNNDVNVTGAPAAQTFQKSQPEAPRRLSSDELTEQLVSGDGFYHGGSPTLHAQQSLLKSEACGSCGAKMPSMLSKCPSCGAGVGGKTLSKGHVFTSSTPVLRAKSKVADDYIPPTKR